MMEAVRNGAWAKSGGGVPTARDYVQDGLIAMWDGIENAGWGVHDPNATVWKDLIGGRELTIPSTTDSYMWGLNELTRDGVGGIDKTFQDIAIDATSPISIEHIFSADIIPTITSSSYYIWTINLDLDRIFYSGNNNLLYTANTGGFISTGISGNIIPRTSLTFAIEKSSAGVKNAVKSYINGITDFTGFVTSGWNGFNGRLQMFKAIRNWVSRSVVSFHSLRIYNRALMPAEVAANYAIDKARFNLP